MAICTSATMPLFFNVPVRGGTPGKILVLKRNVSRLPALLQLGLHFISHSWECPGTLCSLNLKVESVINELQYCSLGSFLARNCSKPFRCTVFPVENSDELPKKIGPVRYYRTSGGTGGLKKKDRSQLVVLRQVLSSCQLVLNKPK